MTEENDPKTTPAASPAEAPIQTARSRFDDLQNKTLSLARNHTPLFACGVATILCGLLWFATAATWGWSSVHAPFATAFSFGCLAAGYFLNASNKSLSRWLFAAAIGTHIAGWTCLGSLHLLVCALALLAAAPVLGRSGFPSPRALDAMAFVACLAAWFAVLFRVPAPLDHIGAIRTLLFLLPLGWSVAFLVLRSRPLPASWPANSPRIALLAVLALVLVLVDFGFDRCGLVFVKILPAGLLLAALLMSALDDGTNPDADGSRSGTWIRRYAPAAAAILNAVFGFVGLGLALSLYCQYGGGNFGSNFLVQLAIWLPWLLLAALLTARCGKLKKEDLRRSLASARRIGSARMHALHGTLPPPAKSSPGSMPVSWITMKVIAWLALGIWIVLALLALLNDNLRLFSANGFVAAYCGAGALLTALWFLHLALCRKFEEGVAALESHCRAPLRTPMCSSWIILYQLGMVMIVLLSVSMIATFIASLSGNLSGAIPFCLLLFLLALAPHFLNLFLARRFHEAVCVLESAAGEQKPDPGPMPVSWHVTRVVLWIVTAVLLVTGVVLIVMAFIPRGSYSWGSHRSWHEWGYLWIGVQCCLADIPLAFGFLILYLIKRFWSAVACLRVLTFRPAEPPPPPPLFPPLPG